MLAPEIAKTQAWGEIVNLKPKPPNVKWPQFQTEIYSIPKSGMDRRRLSIVNPISQMRVANIIASHWSDILARIKETECSAHVPKIDGKSPLQHFNFQEFVRRQIDVSARHDKIVSADILRFYGSLYTHAIAWALHGKDKFQSSHPSERRKMLGDILDQAVRFGQENQSVGIPVGPYTSRIISEIVGVGIDEALGCHQHQAVRHIDDWRVGVASSETPQKIIAKIAAACREFGFDLNYGKTEVIPNGEFAGPTWRTELLQLGWDRTKNAGSIGLFFAKAFDWAKTHPDANVLSYAVQVAGKWTVHPNCWNLLESCLLSVARFDPKTLGHVAKILAKRSDNVNRERMSDFVHDVIRSNAPLGHHFEVSWALSLAKEFDGINISEDAAQEVCKMESSVCALLLLDLYNNGRVRGKLCLDKWQSWTTPDGLKTRMWLLVYEARKRDWLATEEGEDGEDEKAVISEKTPEDRIRSFFDKERFNDKRFSSLFGILWENTVSFYDEKKTIAKSQQDDKNLGEFPENMLY